MTNKQIANRIVFLCEVLPGKLRQIPAASFRARPEPDKWSPQEIMGYLIDSTANNHQRFVRAQLQDTPTIFYDQDQWVRVQAYEQADRNALISFWEMYNRHLVHLIRYITQENLA